VPGWLRTSLLVAAALGGALLLWVGFALLVAVLLIVAIPFAIWSAIVRRRAPRGSVTIEGSATRVEEKVVLDQPSGPDSAPGAPRGP